MRAAILLIIVFINLLIPVGIYAEESLQSRVQTLIETTKQNMVFVKGGSFMMGDPGTDVKADNGRIQHLPLTMYTNDDFVHEVTLDNYWIGKFEVTYGEFDVFTEATGRPRYLEQALKEPWRQGSYPTGVPSWFDAKAYCEWIATLTGLPFDLPTEAQWEYAGRSRGRDVWYATDNGKIDLGRNIVDSKNYDIKPVGSYPPNPLGIYDMNGNVSEWVNDWYDENYYRSSPQKNPLGPESGVKKIFRGCAFTWSQAAFTYGRYPESPTSKGGMELGVRCVCNSKKPKAFSK